MSYIIGWTLLFGAMFGGVVLIDGQPPGQPWWLLPLLALPLGIFNGGLHYIGRNFDQR